MHLHLTPPALPRDEDFEALKLGLNSFNEAFTGKLAREKISAFVKDGDGAVLGGVLGEIKWGWLYIEGLWVDAAAREQHWGSRLLASMEEYACAKDVAGFRMETTSFQALGFYQQSGYSVFGELPGFPPGHTSYFLKKLSRPLG